MVIAFFTNYVAENCNSMLFHIDCVLSICFFFSQCLFSLTFILVHCKQTICEDIAILKLHNEQFDKLGICL